MTDEDDADFGEEYTSSFVGCTCDHDSDQHGWGRCEVADCPCEGGWEE